MNRRKALSLMALGAGGAAGPASAATTGSITFGHGVASGDPFTDRVILWTRVTPASASAAIPLSWEIVEDAPFRRVVARGSTRTGADRDFTVKVDATGLKPGRDYLYRFKAGGAVSPVGRTRTLPSGATGKVVLAVVTCALYPNGSRPGG